MKRVFFPAQAASGWQRLLAQPSLHWKRGRSAMTAAACWEAADGLLPPDVARTLESANVDILTELQLVAAFPEWEVALPGGERPSCTDVLALARNQHGLVALAIEAKVDEAFGPTLLEKRHRASVGQSIRIDYLHDILQLPQPLEGTVRYQLLHRAASAILIAKQFHARTAVMLVHSFSPSACRRDDYLAFCSAMSAKPLSDQVSVVPGFERPELYLAWCTGDRHFLNVELPSSM